MDWNALDSEGQQMLARLLAAGCSRVEIDLAIGRAFGSGTQLSLLVLSHRNLPDAERFVAQLTDLVAKAVAKERLKSFVKEIQRIKLGYPTIRNLAYLVAVGRNNVSISGAPSVDLQSAASSLGMVDFSALMSRLAEIREASCRFVRVVGDKVRSIGTGILVGDDLVLTAYHVLKCEILLDRQGNHTPLSTEIKCQFDFDTEEAKPKPVLAELSRGKNWIVAASPVAADPSASSASDLDYILVRLESRCHWRTTKSAVSKRHR